MNVWRYNDHELLYLINLHSDEAMDIMFLKYEKLIYKKIYQFNFNREYFDDLVQESKMVLYKAIKRYNTKENKTFTKYFEMILEHKLIDLLKKLKKNNNLIYEENFDLYKSTYEETNLDSLVLHEEQDYNKYLLSSLEKEIYDYKFIRNFKVSFIAEKLSLSPVQISNAIQRIKQKLKITK